MNYFRAADQRGHANFGWLDSHHSFSFGSYYDADHMGVSTLRVINDDRMAPDSGFATHGHQDMEIISYVLEGGVRHADSMGNEYVVPAGDVQLMSAGSGVTHSEYNASSTGEAHFLQIWITPDVTGTDPGYQQNRFAPAPGLTPIVTADGRDGSLVIRQNASVYRLSLDAGQTSPLPFGNQGYLHVIEGDAEIGNVKLSKSDGLGFDSSTLESGIQIVASSGLHALYFDLP